RHEGREEEGEKHDAALVAENLVDLTATGRQHNRAEDGTETLDGHRDGDHDLLLVIDPDNRYRGAVQRRRDLRKVLAVVEPIFLLDRVVVGEDPVIDHVPDRGEHALLFLRDGRKLEAQHIAAAIEIAAVNHQQALAVEYAGADIGR